MNKLGLCQILCGLEYCAKGQVVFAPWCRRKAITIQMSYKSTPAIPIVCIPPTSKTKSESTEIEWEEESFYSVLMVAHGQLKKTLKHFRLIGFTLTRYTVEMTA